MALLESLSREIALTGGLPDARKSYAAGDGDGDGGDDDDQQHKSVALESQCTIWKHCGAYIPRSRQRKDAEMRRWKAPAIQHGAPDHELDRGLVDEDGNLPAHLSLSLCTRRSWD